MLLNVKLHILALLLNDLQYLKRLGSDLRSAVVAFIVSARTMHIAQKLRSVSRMNLTCKHYYFKRRHVE